MKNTWIAHSEKYGAHLARLTGKPTVTASDMIGAQWGQQELVVSSALRSLADKLSEIASVRRHDLLETTLRSSQSVFIDHFAQGDFVSVRVDEHRCLSTEDDDCTVRFAAQSGHSYFTAKTAGGWLYLSRPCSMPPPAPSALKSQNWAHTTTKLP